MSILKVANVHFEATGTNRIDYLGDDKIRITSANGTVLSGATTDALIRVTQTGTGDAIRVEDSANPDATPFVVDANGRVGIGTVASESIGLNIVYPGLQIQVTDGTVAQRVGYAVGTVAYSGTASNHDYILLANDAERIRIQPSGNVLIGRTNSTVGQGVKLDVNGAANTSDILVNGVSVSPFGRQTIWVPASAMTSRITNGPSSGTIETATNKVVIKTLDFDTTTQESAQFAIQMPKSWNESSLICQFVWSHPTTTTNFGVVWGIESVAFADNDAFDTAFGANTTISDTGGTANNIYISGETSALTVAGSPGSEEYVVFQIFRNAANTSDSMAVDARLHGVKIHYTIDAAKDN